MGYQSSPQGVTNLDGATPTHRPITPLRSLAILSQTKPTITTITTAAGSPHRARPDHQLAPRGQAHVLAAPLLLHPASRVIPSHPAARRTELTRGTGTNRVAGLQE